MLSFLNKNILKSINVNELDGILDSIKLIDIREPYETSAGTIKGAKNIPMNALLANPQKYLNKDTEYYLLCQSGNRSSRVANILMQLGYKVINVAGGFGSYRGKNIKR